MILTFPLLNWKQTKNQRITCGTCEFDTQEEFAMYKELITYDR